ncbi:PA3715 family protein [Lysobacter tyrosinilyticus]
MRRDTIGTGRCGGRMHSLWLMLLLGYVSTWPAHAQGAAPRFTADTPVRALPQAEFDAIVAEATAVGSRPRKTFVQPLPAHWRTLDPTRLSAMLTMPAFAQIPEHTRGVLLNQAATWDLLSFRRPSDAAALWERIWPRAYYVDPKAAPNSEGIGYEPDPTWTPEAMALSTIFACFPREVWAAEGDAALWAMRNPGPWQWENYSGWDGFRECLPEGAFFSETRPNRKGLAAMAEVLRRKFTDALLTDGCSRPGPDSCMLLYQALFALDRRNPQLPELLKRMEPSFDLSAPIELPPVRPSRDEPSDGELQALYAPETEALRRNLFVTLKLPVLLQEPAAWPTGELERTLEQAARYTVLLARIEKLKAYRRNWSMDRYYGNPWQWIDARLEPRVAAQLRSLGAGYAQREGCAVAGFDMEHIPATFWQGYVMENIRLGHGACERFDALRLADRYRAASRSRDHAMGELESIAPMLMQDGPLHEEAWKAVAETCRAMKSTRNDPWQLCAEVARRDAQRAAQEVAEERERIATLPPVDPLACPEDMIGRAAQALQFPMETEFPNDNTACRLDPTHRNRAIVALSYRKGEEVTGQAENEDSAYDLDLVVMDVRTDRILAQRHEPAAIESDAIRFEGLSIDADGYRLALGRRAFGLSIEHSAHCYQCAYSETRLVLYLPKGHQLEPVLTTTVSESNNESSDECPNAVASASTSIGVGNKRSHGLADLELATRHRVDDDSEEGASAQCVSDNTTAQTWRFDGKHYVAPAQPGQQAH